MNKRCVVEAVEKVVEHMEIGLAGGLEHHTRLFEQVVADVRSQYLQIGIKQQSLK